MHVLCTVNHLWRHLWRHDGHVVYTLTVFMIAVSGGAVQVELV